MSVCKRKCIGLFPLVKLKRSGMSESKSYKHSPGETAISHEALTVKQTQKTHDTLGGPSSHNIHPWQFI